MFKPTVELKSIFDITPEALINMGIKGLILDIDNTLTTHDNPEPADGVTDWLADMKLHKIRMVVLSNNSAERVKPFADMLGLRFVSKAKKPLGKGFRQAMRELKLPKNQICVVGDQIYTDILGANLAGVKSILVPPFEAEKTLFFRFKRLIERPFRNT